MGWFVVLSDPQIISGIIGAASAIVGSIVGGIITYKTTNRQLEYQSKQYKYEKKLELFNDFITSFDLYETKVSLYLRKSEGKSNIEKDQFIIDSYSPVRYKSFIVSSMLNDEDSNKFDELIKRHVAAVMCKREDSDSYHKFLSLQVKTREEMILIIKNNLKNGI